MRGFGDNQKQRIDALELEVSNLRAEINALKYENEILIGELPALISFRWGVRDPRPKTSVREVLMLILKEMGLELTHTKAYEKVDLVRPVKAKSK